MNKIEEMIFPTNMVEEVSQSFLDYSLSVITDRALPDVRDGMKPVHRRIIYTMFENGLFNAKMYKKSADTVGSVLGRYHCHGDSSVYEAMVRLAQSFSLRYPLVDGHGAFGDIDGNPAAHMRYTEARLSKIAEEMTRDLKKDTVDWKLNFSEDLYEPIVLPSRFPNLLVNGSTGIAVGMACSFAPHNLTEIVDAIVAYLKDSEISDLDLFNIIGGPDFPTGGLVVNKDELFTGYKTGKGRIRIRSKYKVETRGKKTLIVFYELPYMTKKNKIIEDIVMLCESKEIEGIADVRDESDTNIALVIELNKGFDADNIANILFAKTQLENTYSINNTCLVNNEPKVLSTKELVRYYVEFQQEVLIRRSKFELAKILKRLNVIEALIIALANIDEVIAIIKGSENSAAAQAALLKKFFVNEEQAKAVLDMKLARLTRLQVQELKEEEEELVYSKVRLEIILGDIKELNKVFIEELSEIQRKYKSPRRTEISQVTVVKDKKNKPEVVIKPITLAIDNSYNIKFIEPKAFKNKKNTNDYNYIITTDTSDSLSIFMNNGKVYKLPLHELKDNSNIIALLEIKNEKIIDILADTSKKFIVFLTKQGMVKKTLLEEYKNIKRSGIIGISLREDDEVSNICYIDEEPLLILTKNGMSIKFNSAEVTPTSRNTMGVLGIKLKEDDFATSITPVYNNKKYIITITKNGYAKKTKTEEFTLQKRNGVGILGCRLITKDEAFANLAANEEDTIIIYSNDNLIKIPCTDVPTLGRTSQGNHIAKYGNVNNIHII